jgi:hypothetical protein
VATPICGEARGHEQGRVFAEPRERADTRAFDRLMGRKGGEPPLPDDVIA